MPATSFHKPTGKYLTSFGAEAKAGDIHTISLGSTSKLHRYGLVSRNDGRGTPKTNEFTTYLLSEPVAHDQFGPLFDLHACASACPLDYDGAPTADAITALAALPVQARHAA